MEIFRVPMGMGGGGEECIGCGRPIQLGTLIGERNGKGKQRKSRKKKRKAHS